ncbi:MAG: penicillin-binding transpeptidase domain-containing protein, partial [Planctomycetota bacterium]
MTTADDSVDIAPPISSGRIGLVLGLIALGMLGLVGRVVYLQTQFAAEMGDRVERQHRSVSGLAARRGSIFDRNGLMLAGTTLERDVFADPKFLHDEFAKTGRPLIELDVSLERVADRIAADPDKVALAVTGEPDKRYVPLAREMDADVAEAAVEYARSLDLRGIASQPSPRRSYPMARLASHVLGTVGRDGQGLEGIEAKHDDHLAGENGRVVTIRDKRRRAIQSFSDGVRPPEHGNGLVLTLDSRIQHIVERELAATVEAFQAEGASCVVLDPHTGDVLALANLPEYDPRFPGDFDVADRRNRAIVDPYEPGSVVKPFLMAAMLDTGVTSIDEVFVTGKTTRLDNGRRVTDDYGYEQLVGWDVVVKSSNIAMAKAVG